jgi:hypothetical protein
VLEKKQSLAGTKRLCLSRASFYSLSIQLFSTLQGTGQLCPETHSLGVGIDIKVISEQPGKCFGKCAYT